jgi:23S rRNA (cytidine2498-2'-O)-methyltransferase
MNLLLAAEDSEAELRSELAQAFPNLASSLTSKPAVYGALLVPAEFEILPHERLPELVFARQLLPHARAVRSESIRDWAWTIAAEVAGALPEEQPWSLHIGPHYGARVIHRIGARAWHSATRRGPGGRRGASPQAGNVENAVSAADAGRHRCDLIRDGVIDRLQKVRRHLLRRLQQVAAPFTPQSSLVQVLLTNPEAGFLSIAHAPVPFEQRHLISPFPKGFLPIASDKSAPSRAFAKLSEALLRFGHPISSGEICVDLGAAPGSWTWFTANRGARVIAVDRALLREDLMGNRMVQFQTGDAFRFAPVGAVDWLLCDVIAPPQRNAGLLLKWLRNGWCRNFVVTLKLQEEPGTDVLPALKSELPPLTREVFVKRLCANKKEVCAFGSAR